MKEKLTRFEWYWILYAVGNSGFSLMLAAILSLYFNHLAQQAQLTSA